VLSEALLPGKDAALARGSGGSLPRPTTADKPPSALRTSGRSSPSRGRQVWMDPVADVAAIPGASVPRAESAVAGRRNALGPAPEAQHSPSPGTVQSSPAAKAKLGLSGRPLTAGTPAPLDASAWSPSPTSASTSRPGSRGSAGCHVPPCRPGTGRFSQEEMRCFKRSPTPSSQCDAKHEIYWQSGANGEIRRCFSDSGLHTLPVLKGQFYNHPRLRGEQAVRERERARARRRAERLAREKEEQKVELMPEEALTAGILDEIYPRKLPPRSPGGEERGGSPTLGSGQGGPGDIVTTADGEEESFQRSPKQGEGKRGGLLSSRRTPNNRSGRPGTGDPSTPSAERGFGALSVGTASEKRGGMMQSFASTGGGLGMNSTSASTMAKTLGTGPGLVQEFRKRLLQQFSTMREAFEAFQCEWPAGRDITKKEWRRVIGKLGFEWSTKEERDAIFDGLDLRSEGHVAMSEFQLLMEAAAPVLSLENLRRRWLASGFATMQEAIDRMEEVVVNKDRERLSLQEFGEVLRNVHVHDFVEHSALFNAISIDSSGRTTISELASAIATVSPSLVLEDIAYRLLKQAGSLEKVFDDLDVNRDKGVALPEFIAVGCRRLQLSEYECAKAFRAIDVENTGQISKVEFVSAIGLSKPSLFLEDLRLKIRQRFRSIQEAFTRAFSDTDSHDGDDSEPALNLVRFQELLLPLDLKELETRTLFNLVDINHDGGVTVKEFVIGVMHFAPSGVLEDVRALCFQRQSRIVDVFGTPGSPQFLRALDKKALSRILMSLGLLGDPPVDPNLRATTVISTVVQAIFDLIDVKHDGLVNLARLVAALQNCGAGSRAKLQGDELGERARADIHEDLFVAKQLADTVRTQVREGLTYDELGGATGAESVGSPSPPRSPVAVSADAARPSSGTPTSASGGSPPSRLRRTQSSPGMRRSEAPEKAPQQAAAIAGGAAGRSVAGSGISGAVTSNRNSPDAGAEAKGGVAPRLKVMAAEELVAYVPGIMHAKKEERQKPSQACVAGTQTSYNNIWEHVHKSPGKQHRGKLQKDLFNYFQTAAWSLSHDVPLYQGMQHSRFQQYQEQRKYDEALKPGYLKAAHT